MRFPATLTALLAVFVFGLLTSPGFSEVVGHLTQVEGRVDLLKGGQLPSTPAKVGDGVEPGDVIRTKSLSRAQITFLDNSVLSISPESRIAINDYTLDLTQGKRNAVLEVFQGVAMAVVTKIFKTEKPDFVVKTHTAVMGIRGTEVGIRLAPNSSTFLDFTGHTTVSNVFPEVKGAVNLGPMEGTVVERGLPPTLPFQISKEDQQLFIRQLAVPMPIRNVTQQTTNAATPGPQPTGGTTTTNNPVALEGTSPTANTQAVINYLSVVVPTPTLLFPTYNFTQTFTGTYAKTAESPYNMATFASSSPGSGIRSGVYGGPFTSSFAITATAPANVFPFSPSSSGSITATSIGTVTGPPGGILTGTMQMQASTSGSTSFNFTGPVTIQPTGNLNYSTQGTFSLMGLTGTTTGTWTQTPR